MVRRLLIGGVIAATVLGVAAYAYYRNETKLVEKRGSATEEFDTSSEPSQRKAPTRERIKVPWSTYGYDLQRTKVSPYDHRPPYRTKWRLDGLDTLEFPPSVGYGNIYLAQQKGLFFGLNAKTGKPIFKTKDYKRCAASSPTIGKRYTLYQAYMHPVPCVQDAANPTGFIVAKDTRTGREKWRFDVQPIESSPLLRGNRLYFGSWDGNVYAINATTGKQIWSTSTGAKVNTSAAYSNGRIFIANDDGNVYGIDAKTGRQIWQASSQSQFGSREFFYASPTVAYGRVFIGNSDGTMYAFGTRSGKTLWARPLGTYIYSGAAVYERKVYVGTYDGSFYALDAATGDTTWQREMPSAVHAAPTVMDGLVYVATCSSCGTEASRAVKMGTDSTTAFNAISGKQVWRNNAGKYANPIVADQDRVYLTGRSFLYGLRPVAARRRGGSAGGPARLGVSPR